MPRFVHLQLHSEYSLQDGIVTLPKLIDKLKAHKMPAVALTDHNNIFAAVKFYKACVNAGIKPILGADLSIKHTSGHSQLTVLCQNAKGYHNLCVLLAKAYREGQETHHVFVHEAWFGAHAEGLIAIIPAHHNNLHTPLRKNDDETLTANIRFWQSTFPDRLYLALVRTGMPGDEQALHDSLNLAERFKLPVIASNAVRFIEPDDFEAHEARVCIHRGEILNNAKRPRLYSDEQYLRDENTMCELFSDIPEALQNTVEIAKRCNFAFEFGQTFLPDFPTPDNMSLDDYIDQMSHDGLNEKLPIIASATGKTVAELRPEYETRLRTELDVIKGMGFPGYFLIVADFIQWAKNNGIPVGPGRGSGAGSLVAYVLKITDLDPIYYELLFERFLNPERVSMPDFDIDFCMEGRDRVIEYVAQKYGRDSVSQIITFGTMAAKAVVRDVGRVLNHGYGFVDRIAKCIPFEIGMTLDKALQEPALKELYDHDDEVRTIIDLAKKLEGISRNAGKHAGGVVIAPGQLTDFTAVYCEQGSTQIVSQFDKDDIETIGLVKFDFLGLRTLTIIDWAIKLINARLTKQNAALLDIHHIPLDDKPSFKLLQACDTTAVFQLESRGMKDLIKRLQPDHFEEIIALVALFRPGPLQSGMVDDFINRKHGRAQVVYAHPLLEPILKPTYGVILYQEQVMQIAQDLAGYTLGAADILRRAMGKKKPEEMAKQREIFTQGAVNNKIELKTAEYVFDLMEKFAGYGFNKSHSAAYALIAYQTAYLKSHYPAEFMAAVLSSDMDNTDKVVNFINDCKHLKIDILPPEINTSEYKFTPTDDGHIRFGLGAIKGAGESALDVLIQERDQNGPFKSFYDLCHRVDSRKVNKRVFEALIKSGALDNLGPLRSIIYASLPVFMRAAEQHGKNAEQNQEDLFGAMDDDAHHLEPEFAKAKPWPEKQLLSYEKETLGFYFSGHPFESVREELAHITSSPLSRIASQQGKTATAAGLISNFRTVKTKRGNRMAIFTLDDGEATLDCIAFSETYEKHRDALRADNLIIATGEVSLDEFTENFRLAVKDIYTLQAARTNYGKHVQIHLDPKGHKPETMNTLKHILTQFKGKLPVYIHYQNAQARTLLPLGEQWTVTPSDEFFETLKNELGLQANCVFKA
ncbi:MAG: DNA polymerase III subunit alpha [Gammaproteobacteria bacterium CG11_big_fil_rev_8_21_14_0_20_46_22]|nr:MAG: DNA polymerase III subunit alpha [Gammaproteobacteria bacterium CG12_big_fil_rev_8_21_14_0_65_46_12]PIR11361.1 MAG: DNA polymerase III subunit alpha [Gammaproteobacteria bacterium CG11_big_fil_rev_8_21_14_0_20_46_22]